MATLKSTENKTKTFHVLSAPFHHQQQLLFFHAIAKSFRASGRADSPSRPPSHKVGFIGMTLWSFIIKQKTLSPRWHIHQNSEFCAQRTLIMIHTISSFRPGIWVILLQQKKSKTIYNMWFACTKEKLHISLNQLLLCNECVTFEKELSKKGKIERRSHTCLSSRPMMNMWW